MNNSRPRASILSLFDPLSATPEPSTPPRNDSPTVDSDKENENPPKNELTLTTFFNRTYKPQHLSPKPLRRRLIDVGDVTVDAVETSWLGDDDDEGDFQASWGLDDDENETLTFRQMAVSATPKWTTPRPTTSTLVVSPTAGRTPLAELVLDHDPDATPRNKPAKCQLGTGSSKLAIVVTEPDGSEEQSPLQQSFARPSPEERLSIGSTFASSTSSLTVSSLTRKAEARVVETGSTADLTSLTASTFSLDTSRLRPASLRSSVNSQNRHSIDLQSSFQMHLDSEATFDLLNDKISFFDSDKDGLESRSHDFGEGSFDLSFEEAKLEVFTAALGKASKLSPASPYNTLSKEKMVAGEVSADQQVLEHEKVSEATVPDDLAVESLVSYCSESEEKVPAARVRAPSTPLEKAQFIAPLPQAGAVTPRNVRSIRAILPPLVAGLKIVKRSKFTLQKETPPIPVVPAPISREIKSKATEINRRPSPRTSLSGTTVPLEQPNVTRAVSRPSSTTRGTLVSEGSGPRRVLRDQESKPATSASRTNPGRPAASNVAGAGPRRVPLASNTTSNAGSARIPVSTSSRQVPAASYLPKPASRPVSSIPQPSARVGSSRLPAPSVIVRPTAGGIRDVARGVPIRKVV
ncbi:hypothetical protein FA15DRAFT_662890 [Coprinopsis marcescibilis]|uniref:Uncharacterized protein n=1 Tax=Coprinopsis marcescibilis TaxID=230819 RepID=A0A5C3LDI3_COPMA|nr:hypothetical protein FA15DRAFT_662890 [Coprinopsis marcescibilis]